MIGFEKLSLNDAEKLKIYFSHDLSGSCDSAVGTEMIWKELFGTEIYEDGNVLILSVKYPGRERAFLLPFGDTSRGLDMLSEYCREKSVGLRFTTVTSSGVAAISKKFPQAKITPMRDFYDYVYKVESFKTFAGRKLSGQRNHKNNFIKNHPDWSFEEINSENMPEVRVFFDEYNSETEKSSPYFAAEKDRIYEILEDPAAFGLFGGVLREKEHIYGFSFGEIKGEYLFVHIEKALHGVNGAYQMLASEFVTGFANENTKFVNREDDAGDEGLRISKTAYHPEFMIEKYDIEI